MNLQQIGYLLYMEEQEKQEEKQKQLNFNVNRYNLLEREEATTEEDDEMNYYLS